jgi:hypothetical protein
MKIKSVKQNIKAKQRQRVKQTLEVGIGSSGRIRTYDLAVNSRPLYR